MTKRNLSPHRYTGRHVTNEGMELYIPTSGFEMPSLPSEVDPFAETSAQKFPLGTKLVYGEQTFRYCRNGGTALLVANLVQAVVPLAGHINEAITTWAVGDTTVGFTPNTVTTDDLAKDELQDGYIYVYDNTGEGHMYKVASHAALTGGESGNIVLLDPVRVAPIAASVATIVHNRFFKVIVHPSPPTAAPLGWAPIPVTADYFFWLLTAGPTTMMIDGTVVLGKQVRPSEDDNGAVAALTYDEGTSSGNSDYGPVGWVMDIGADAAGAAATFGFGIATLE